MTTRYRHRRYADPTIPFPATIEPGEIAANTANRQIAIGDAAQASPGVPTPLLAVRFFDARGKYAVGDYVVEDGQLYRCLFAHGPAAFDEANFDAISSQEQIVGALDNFLLLSGGTMSGPLFLPNAAPTIDAEAANKKYVDDRVATAATGDIGAGGIANTPAGGIQATDVQAALNELDTEKAPIASPTLTGDPRAPTRSPNDSSTSIATTAFVTGQAALAEPLAPGSPAAIGTSLLYARQDHVHPFDITRAPIFSPDFTGTPTTTPPDPADNSTRIATTAFVKGTELTSLANGAVTYPKLAASAIATKAEFLINAADKLVPVREVWAAAVPVVVADTPTVAPNLDLGIDFIWTIGAVGRTLGTPFNVANKIGQKGVLYIACGIANASITTWSAVYKFPGGTKPTLSVTVGAVDTLAYMVKSASEVHCFFSRDMK